MSILCIRQQASNAPITSDLNVMSTLKLWLNKHQQRKALKTLDDALLDDIGISREEALAEAHLPFWK